MVGIVLAHYLNVVSSESMEPVLYTGDIVLISYETNNVDVGDVVIYDAKWYDHKPVIHRVVAKHVVNGTNIYILKGDNNPKEDPYLVYPEDIIATVVKVNNKEVIIPKLGYISIWFHEAVKYIFGQTILYPPS
jgi:signal peptidase